MDNKNHCNRRLPSVKYTEPIKCFRIYMDNGEDYTIKTNDMVAIQFVKDNKRILVRRGRIKDFFVVNKRQLSKSFDDVSHIVLDCSEQFSIKIIDIRFCDIIKIGGIDDEFDDYSDRLTTIEPNYIDGDKLPVRKGGLVTEEEVREKITKPNRKDVVKMDPDTGRFDDLYEMNMNRPDIEYLKEEEKPVIKGVPLMR